MPCHAIRLLGPWEYQALSRVTVDGQGQFVEQTGNLPPSGRQRMPADWSDPLGADFRGRVQYIRRFAAPTNLDPHEQVWLVLEAIRGQARIRLNGEPLDDAPTTCPARFEITALLRPRNALEIEVELLPSSAATAAGGIVGEVRLEIESSLRGPG